MKITISGLPAAGKGKLRKNLEKELSIKSFSVGDLRREFASQQGMSIQEFNKLGEKDPTTDTKADKYQIEWAKKQGNFILDGRLSYHFLPETIRIFLTADEKTRAQRILHANRDSEKKAQSITEQIQINKQRCESDQRRYKKIYKIKNCYDPNNFDIVIDTSNKTPEESAHLTLKKIVDYNQKMFPPKFYLAHPTEAKDKIREWELGFEKRTGIQLINPFFDCHTPETEMGHLGKEKYLCMTDKQRAELIRGDLERIAAKDMLGGIFFFDDSYTLGTPVELSSTQLMGKLAYTVTTHTTEAYRKHPVIALFSDKKFRSLNNLERFLTKNKPEFFKLLEQSRKGTFKDKTLQAIYDVLMKNKKYRAQ